MKETKLFFYEVDDSYVEYLSKFDSHVMYTKIESRKFKRKYIGILFKIDEKLYIAPLSSYKQKHNKMKESIDATDFAKFCRFMINNILYIIVGLIAFVIIGANVARWIYRQKRRKARMRRRMRSSR